MLDNSRRSFLRTLVAGAAVSSLGFPAIVGAAGQRDHAGLGRTQPCWSNDCGRDHHGRRQRGAEPADRGAADRRARLHP